MSSILSEEATVTLAQFPLGSVLFPGMGLPLQIFEPRFREMLADVLTHPIAGIADITQPPVEGNEPVFGFGVALIERGSEVGGGDVRTMAGTLARIVDTQILPDGRATLVAVGVERFRIIEWLDDAPYPRAVVRGWPDQADDDSVPLAERRDRAESLLRRSIDLATALAPHPDAPIQFTIDDEPGPASYQIATLAPLSSFDKQSVLLAPSPGERLDRLCTDLQASIEMLEFRLQG